MISNAVNADCEFPLLAVVAGSNVTGIADDVKNRRLFR
jgi:hypothetical protein